MLTRAMGVSFPAMTFSMETNVVPCSSRLCCSTDGQRQRLDRRNAKEPRRKLEHVFSHTLISMRRVSGKAALGRWAEAEELQGSPAAAVAGPPLEGSSPLRLARRQAMSLPVLLAALISFPQDATSEEAGLFLYEDQEKGFSLLVPATWTQKEKAGATALFEDPERKSTNVGVVVNPVRITSLKDFGTLEFVAGKLLAAETRKESTKAASIITSRASEKGPDNTLYYNFEYSLESTRGNKRLLTTVAVSRKQLFILNIALPEGFLDAPSTTGGKDTLLEELERVQESFQVL